VRPRLPPRTIAPVVSEYHCVFAATVLGIMQLESLAEHPRVRSWHAIYWRQEEEEERTTSEPRERGVPLLGENRCGASTSVTVTTTKRR